MESTSASKSSLQWGRLRSTAHGPTIFFPRRLMVALSRNKPLQGKYLINMPAEGEINAIPSGTETVIRLQCNKCHKQGFMSLGKIILTFTLEEIRGNSPCNCGGIYRGHPGKYMFKNGELVLDN